MLGNQQAGETLDKSPRRMWLQRIRLGSEELQVRWKTRTTNQDAVDLYTTYRQTIAESISADLWSYGHKCR